MSFVGKALTGKLQRSSSPWNDSQNRKYWVGCDQHSTSDSAPPLGMLLCTLNGAVASSRFGWSRWRFTASLLDSEMEILPMSDLSAAAEAIRDYKMNASGGYAQWSSRRDLGFIRLKRSSL